MLILIMSMMEEIISALVELQNRIACSDGASAHKTGLCRRCTKAGKQSYIVLAGDHVISQLYTQGTTSASSMDLIIKETSGPADRSRLEALWRVLHPVLSRFRSEQDCELMINPISIINTTGVVGS